LKRDAEGKVCVCVNEKRPLLYAELMLRGQKLGIFGTHLHHVNYSEHPDGIRKAEAETLLSRINEHPELDSIIVAGDFNQPRKVDMQEAEWKVVAEACRRFKSPENDGVSKLLQDAGFRASWDLPGTGILRNYPADSEYGAPPMTHWTGTTLDFMYVHTAKRKQDANCGLIGMYVVFTDLSDHLPLVADMRIE
jgi:endonuclease/exonuclease/phosphatase family metal-dependent hydrolase